MNVELPRPNGMRTKPRLIVCMRTAQVVGAWHLGQIHIPLGQGSVHETLGRLAESPTPWHSMRVEAASMP